MCHTYGWVVGASVSLKQWYVLSTNIQRVANSKFHHFFANISTTQIALRWELRHAHLLQLNSISSMTNDCGCVYICACDVKSDRLQSGIENDDSVSLLTILSCSHYSNDECFHAIAKAWICQTNKHIIRKMLNDFLWFKKQQNMMVVTLASYRMAERPPNTTKMNGKQIFLFTSRTFFDVISYIPVLATFRKHKNTLVDL